VEATADDAQADLAKPFAPIRVPVSSAVALVIAVALTLLMIFFASPLDTYAQTAASALFR
jgi:hypothetical protein